MPSDLASEETLPNITDIPILFLSGLQDEIVPYAVPLLFCKDGILTGD